MTAVYATSKTVRHDSSASTSRWCGGRVASVSPCGKVSPQKFGCQIGTENFNFTGAGNSKTKNYRVRLETNKKINNERRRDTEIERRKYTVRVRAHTRTYTGVGFTTARIIFAYVSTCVCSNRLGEMGVPECPRARKMDYCFGKLLREYAVCTTRRYTRPQKTRATTRRIRVTDENIIRRHKHRARVRMSYE